MSSDASAAATGGDLTCPQCQGVFRPKRPHQRFCRSRCRSLWHEQSDGALRGIVSKVSVMKRGIVSVVIRFDLEDRDQALELDPGKVVEVVRP